MASMEPPPPLLQAQEKWIVKDLLPMICPIWTLLQEIPYAIESHWSRTALIRIALVWFIPLRQPCSWSCMPASSTLIHQLWAQWVAAQWCCSRSGVGWWCNHIVVAVGIVFGGGVGDGGGAGDRSGGGGSGISSHAYAIVADALPIEDASAHGGLHARHLEPRRGRTICKACTLSRLRGVLLQCCVLLQHCRLSCVRAASCLCAGSCQLMD